MTFHKRLLFISSALLVGLTCGFTLGGCDNHKNPLMTQENIGHFSGNLFLSDKKNYPIRSCSNYYGWGKHPEYKAKCEAWTEREYRNSLSGGIIPPETTLKEFRDPKFWQLVNSDAIEDK